MSLSPEIVSLFNSRNLRFEVLSRRTPEILAWWRPVESMSLMELVVKCRACRPNHFARGWLSFLEIGSPRINVASLVEGAAIDRFRVVDCLHALHYLPPDEDEELQLAALTGSLLPTLHPCPWGRLTT